MDPSQEHREDEDQLPLFQRWGRAWVGLCLAVAVHVADEALHDFLTVYNPIAKAIRHRLPWLPMPTFECGVWLGGLVAGILLLLSLSAFAFRGAHWLIPPAYILSVLMIVNGLVHIAGSISFGQLIPGVYSAPLLIAVSVYLFKLTDQLRRG